MAKNPAKILGPIFVFFIILAVVLGWFVWPEKKPAVVKKDLITDKAEIIKIVSAKQKLQTAAVSIGYKEVSRDYQYINIAIDLNQDGVFQNYQTKNGTQAEWLAINMAAIIDPAEAAAYSFLLVDDEALNKNNFSVAINLSQERLTGWQGQPGTNDYNKKIYVDKINTQNLDLLWDITKPLNYGAGAALAAEITLSSSQADMPDITQGKNECAPAATANSIIWLAKKYKFEDKMPSQDELLAELKAYLKWSESSGIDPNNYLAGKKAWAKKRNISLVTKKLGGNYERNLFALIYQELNKGCDVESVIQYQDDAGNPAGAHMVTMAGTYRYSDKSMTEDNISIHDPLSTGPSKSDIYRINDGDSNRVINYRFGQNAFIKEAYSECFVPLGATNIAPPPTEQPPAKTPAASAGTGVSGEAKPITLSATNFSFQHIIGTSPCPQLIGTVSLSGEGRFQKTGVLPKWLSLSSLSGTFPGSISLRFNCTLDQYVTQDLSGGFDLLLTDSEGKTTTKTVNVSGHVQQ